MTKTLSNYKWVGLGVVMGAILLAAASLWPLVAGANPSRVDSYVATASASTSLAYMTPGAGTTTLTKDARSGTDSKFDQVALAIQVTATSTGVISPTLMVRLEDSRDCITYYPRTAVPATATTTLLTADPYNAFSLKIASSTTAPGSTDTSTRLHKLIVADVPLNCVRAVLYDPAGGGNYGVYAELIGIREKQ